MNNSRNGMNINTTRYSYKYVLFLSEAYKYISFNLTYKLIKKQKKDKFHATIWYAKPTSRSNYNPIRKEALLNAKV